MKKTSALIAIAILALLTTPRNSLSAQSPFQSVRAAGSARAFGLSNSSVAIGDDIGSSIFNPAIAYLSRNKLSITFFKKILDVNAGQISYAFPKAQKWAMDGIFAFNVAYVNYGSFQKADANGILNGTFGANDFSMAAVYANKIDTNLYYGVSLELLFFNVEKASAFALAANAGLIYSVPEKNLNFGVSILRAGTQLNDLAGERYPLPLDIRIGFNHKLRGLPLLFNFSFVKLADRVDNFFDKFLNFSLGGEFSFGENVKIRIGYDNGIRKSISSAVGKGFSGLSAGAGASFDSFAIDYGVAQLNASVIVHKLSATINL